MRPLLLLLIAIALGGCLDQSPAGKSKELGVVFKVTVNPADGTALSISETSLRRGDPRQVFKLHDTRDAKTGHVTEQVVSDDENVLIAKAQITESGKVVRVISRMNVKATLEAEGFDEGPAWQEAMREQIYVSRQKQPTGQQPPP